jgi:hypothetical protein
MEWETCFLTKFSSSGLPFSFLEPHFFLSLVFGSLFFIFGFTCSSGSLVSFLHLFLSTYICLRHVQVRGVLRCRVRRPKYPSKSPLFLGSLTSNDGNDDTCLSHRLSFDFEGEFHYRGKRQEVRRKKRAQGRVVGKCLRERKEPLDSNDGIMTAPESPWFLVKGSITYW